MGNMKIKVLDDLINNQARINPKKTVIQFENRSISYETFYADIDKAARMLLGLGIRHSDRVGLMFPNRPEILFLYFACFRIGAIAVPVNTRYQRQEIEYALDHSECKLLIIDKMFSVITKELEQSVPSLQRIIVHSSRVSPLCNVSSFTSMNPNSMRKHCITI